MAELNIHLIVHMDPIITKDESVRNLRHWLAEEVKKVHEDLNIHDLRVVPGETHTNVIFDCMVPRGLKRSDEEIKEAIDLLVKKTYPNYYCVITVDHSYTEMMN